MGYDGQLNPDVDLLEAQILDSFNIVQLAMFIQDCFGIELEARVSVAPTSLSCRALVALIEKRRAPTGA